MYTVGASKNRAVEYPVNIPWIIIVLIAFSVMTYVIINVRKEYTDSRNRLSSTSIKQAFDNLNSGICFSDEKGRIILINYLMADIIYSEIGHYPQTLSEITALFESDDMGELKPSNGSVWSFRTVELKDNNLSGYKQTTALNITVINEVNEKLKQENQHLKQVNDELKVMLEHLSDHIREQETLDLAFLKACHLTQ